MNKQESMTWVEEWSKKVILWVTYILDDLTKMNWNSTFFLGKHTLSNLTCVVWNTIISTSFLLANPISRLKLGKWNFIKTFPFFKGHKNFWCVCVCVCFFFFWRLILLWLFHLFHLLFQLFIKQFSWQIFKKVYFSI